MTGFLLTTGAVLEIIANSATCEITQVGKWKVTGVVTAIQYSSLYQNWQVDATAMDLKGNGLIIQFKTTDPAWKANCKPRPVPRMPISEVSNGKDF